MAMPPRPPAADPQPAAPPMALPTAHAAPPAANPPSKRIRPACDDLHSDLKRLFGMDAFKPGQEQVICALMDGRSAAAIFPTGGGKSLCYQLPSLLFDGGLTVVVSPLIALMKDQVDALRQRGQVTWCGKEELRDRGPRCTVQPRVQTLLKCCRFALGRNWAARSTRDTHVVAAGEDQRATGPTARRAVRRLPPPAQLRICTRLYAR